MKETKKEAERSGGQTEAGALGADSSNFSHLDPESAARAARLLDAYRQSRAESPEDFEFPQAKSAVHHGAGPGPARIDITPTSGSPVVSVTPLPPMRERENSTPPDSPSAIRASRERGELPDSSEPAEAQTSEGDRITLPSIRRQRRRLRFLLLAGFIMLVVLVGIAVLQLRPGPTESRPY